MQFNRFNINSHIHRLWSLPSPLPFEYVEAPPENQFLLIGLVDSDDTCLDRLCACPIGEPVAPPFVVSDGKLQLNQYFFDDESLHSDSLFGANNWPSIRKLKLSTGLLGFQSQWEGELTFISSFPFGLDRFGFEILGFDLQGAIQMKTSEGFVVVLPGQEFKSEQPEQRNKDCKVLHILIFKNYGFIDDKNVVFADTTILNYGTPFPP